MKTYRQQFDEMTVAEKRQVHFYLGEFALSVWREYCVKKKGRIAYIETVCGSGQIVDVELPSDAFRSAKEGRDIKNVAKRYVEPIVSMQDDDLTFPEPVTYAYYAVYNLFNKYVEDESMDDWIIVNQGVSSERDESKWPALLEASLRL